MLKSKVHRARVTDANLDYEGSITIDKNLLGAADILPYERVTVLNINNGARLNTYAIEGEAGSGEICLNGAAARMACPNDLVIIMTYCHVGEGEAHNHQPKIVHVDARNRKVEKSNETIFA